MDFFSRTYPNGVAVPSVIHCPEEILQVTRDGRKATVEATRPASLARLKTLGFQLVPKEPMIDPDLPGGERPGDIVDPAEYQKAIDEGIISEHQEG